jgi:hypothetical protein
MRFQIAGPLSCQKIAAAVSSAVRLVLVSAPSSLISLKSLAYASLESALGPSVRSISTSGTRNGCTLPTHGAGSRATVPAGPCGGPSRQSPASVPSTTVNDPNRPSFARAASMAAAVASPTAMPPAFAGPSSIAASDSLYGVRSAPCCAGKSPTSTLNAAAATAASFENDGSA